jgi:hypothetical protein
VVILENYFQMILDNLLLKVKGLEKSKGCLEKGIPLDFHERRLGK